MRISAISTLFVGTIAAGSAVAGDNNRIDLLQISSGPFGNTLSVDQSEASNSTIAGDRLTITPARQIGDANTADLTITGDGGRIALGQGVPGVVSSGNTAEVIVSGLGGFGEIQQLGNNNNATLNVQSENALFPAEGSIQQFSSSNTANLSVIGTNIRGTLIQAFGNNNTNSLEISGQDSSVVFTQFGSNLTNAGGPGVSVFTDAGNVTITQTNFGTLR